MISFIIIVILWYFVGLLGTVMLIPAKEFDMDDPPFIWLVGVLSFLGPIVFLMGTGRFLVKYYISKTKQ